MGKDRERLFNKLVKSIYAFVLMGAAAIILIQFEGIINFSIYFIYLSAGIILGFSAILILNIFSKDSEY